MPAQQIRTVLDNVRHVHWCIADRFRTLRLQASDDRIRLLLQDMENRERRFDECVAAYQEDEHESVLSTWLQFVPDETVSKERIEEVLSSPGGLDDIVERAMSLNRTLRQTYLELAQEAPITALADLFSDLAKIEESNDRHYAQMLLDA